jgi:hypothetical protein
LYVRQARVVALADTARSMDFHGHRVLCPVQPWRLNNPSVRPTDRRAM